VSSVVNAVSSLFSESPAKYSRLNAAKIINLRLAKYEIHVKLELNK
jgi:hypothetical protein